MSSTPPSDANAGGEPTQRRERTTLEIASVVAQTKGCQPCELEPLSRVTDPDAIEELVNSPQGSELEIEFDYEGGRVTVCSGGDVTYDHPTAASV